MSGSNSAKRVSKPRRPRSVTESLLSITLLLEVFVLFFAGLTAFGLKVLEPAFPAWVALPAAGVFIVVLLITIGLLRFRVGVVIGWVLQAGLIALGILVPMMYVIGIGFTLLYLYCFTRGRRIDAVRTATPTQGEPS